MFYDMLRWKIYWNVFFLKYEFMLVLIWYKIDNGDKELIEIKLLNYLKIWVLKIEFD